MFAPKISVIVPIYNVERYIEQSLRSLFSQSMCDGVEFVLVNDCTPDGSMDVARSVIAEFSALNVKIIEHAENRGVAATRQSGVENASGEYVIHFDPDDLCEPKMLEELYDCAMSSGADVVICDFYTSYVDREIYVSNKVSSDNIDNLRQLIKNSIAGQLWCRLVRRSVICDNEICFTPNINFGEDRLFNIKVSLFANRVAYLPKAYLHYRQNADSFVNSAKKSGEKVRDLLAAIEEIERFLSKHDVLQEFESDLIYHKVRVKNLILSTIPMSEIKQYALLYPETKDAILSNCSIPMRWRIMQYLSVRGYINIAKLFFYTTDFFSSLLRKKSVGRE